MTNYLAIKNQRTVNEYNKALSKYWEETTVITRIIHRQEDLCFNSNAREILYAIRDCFSCYNTYCLPEFRENAYGKCLTLPIEKAYIRPPFENILYYYQQHYFKRLQVIDMYFSRLSTPQHFKDKLVKLITEKKTLFSTRFPYNTFYINGLPLDILNYIFDYLKYIDVHKSFLLRKKYENLKLSV